MGGKFSLADVVGSKPLPFERAGAVSGTEDERSVEVITEEILELKQEAGDAILGIGQRLIEVKEKLDDGEWLAWLTERVDFSPRTAQRFMRLAREWSDATTLSHLGASKALALLALPPEDRDRFISELHEVDGAAKGVIDMSARELQAALRARAEAEAAQKSAEEARDKLSQEMKAANALLEGARRENAEAAKREASLRAELEELRARPIEVVGAAVPDEAALEAARQEGAEAARAQAEQEVRERLEQAQAEAQAAREKLRQAEAAAKEAAQSMAGQLADANARAGALEKRLSSAGSEELAAFKLYYEQARDSFNRMSGLLLKLRDGEERERRTRALRGLLEAMLGNLPQAAGGDAE